MIGRAIAAITTDPVVLARIGGAIGREARAAAAELARDPVERRTQRTAWIADARAPVPAGLRAIDDTNEAYKLGVNYIIYGLTH